MSKTSRNNLIRGVIFLMITAVVIFYLCQVFTYSKTDHNRQFFNEFYSEKENTLDGVHFGTSAINRGWAGVKAFEKYGMAISALASDNQPLALTKYLIEEVEKTQNPKIYIVELRHTYKSADIMDEAYIRRATDNMKPSRTRIEAINAGLEFASLGENNIDTDDKLSHYLPLIKYHGRWNGELEKEDILMQETRNYCKGFRLSHACFLQNPQAVPEFTTEVTPLAEETEAMIIDFLDYCDTLDAKVVFTLAPYSGKEVQLKKINRTIEIVESRGYDILNFTSEEMSDTIGINYDTDFCGPTHMNSLGAEKYTMYVADYIAEHYDLEDHRGDPDYESWEEAYQYYSDYIDEEKAKMIQ